MVEHVNIPNDGLHEPKGIDAAVAGTVYQADGAGSGLWADLPLPTNEVIIENESDFPTPSGGVITLADSTSYRIVGNVSVANKLQWGTGSYLWSPSPNVCKLTYTGTDNFIIAQDQTIRMDGVRFDAPNQPAGKFIIKQDTTGAGLISIVGSRIITDSCGGFMSTLDVALALSYVQVSQFLGTAYDINGTALLVVDLSRHTLISTEAASIGVDLTGSTIQDLSLTNNIFIGPGTAIKGDTGSANLTAGQTGKVKSCNFSLITTNLSGIDSLDDGWHFSENNGQASTHAAGSGYIEGNATATSFAGTGSGNEVKADFGTSFIPASQDQVTVDNTGRFTFTGRDEHEFYFSAEFFGEVTGGASRDYLFFAAKNGVILEESGIKRRYDGSTPGSASCSASLILNEGDYVEFYVRAITATTDLTIETASIKLFGVA